MRLDLLFNYYVDFLYMKRFYKYMDIRFECQADCANCCKLSNGFVFLSDIEAIKIADSLGMPQNEFLQYFTRIIDDQLCLVDGENDSCVFLENNRCTIYEGRPKQCRTYPFWPENLKSVTRWQIIGEECPGIGNGRKYTREEIEKSLP
ncbi:MAG: YkgJ family cysteine cluster protein [Calditrichaceae bacterium]